MSATLITVAAVVVTVTVVLAFEMPPGAAATVYVAQMLLAGPGALPFEQLPRDTVAPLKPSGSGPLTGRVMPMPMRASAVWLASSRRWFQYRKMSYSRPGLCGLVRPSMSVGLT